MALRASKSSSTNKTRESARSSSKAPNKATKGRAQAWVPSASAASTPPGRDPSRRARAGEQAKPAPKRKVAPSAASVPGRPIAKVPKGLAAQKERAVEIFQKLQQLHPDAHCELDHKDAYQLIVATVLSAQTTDKLVNKVTPALFAKYPSAKTLAAAEVAEVSETLRSGGLGMYNQKGKNIVGLAKGIVERHGGEVPRSIDELVKLPGVGRKTANVVLGVMWNIPDGVVVDTHVQRLSQRLGFTKETTPEKIEPALCKLFPRETWDPLSHVLIFHGRRVCFAIKPACSACGVNELCPSAFRAENVGRKNRPPR
ncbi:MAG: endonuclease III [Polyangiaceae bacterium]|nr:endonuclease III [Polyangiaceae bacterium]